MVREIDTKPWWGRANRISGVNETELCAIAMHIARGYKQVS